MHTRGQLYFFAIKYLYVYVYTDMEVLNERKIQVYKLWKYKTEIKRLLSFSENVARCNFTTVTGWKGKTYVGDHDVDEYKPALRGISVVDICYIKRDDYVILTEEQYMDYVLISGAGL